MTLDAVQLAVPQHMYPGKPLSHHIAMRMCDFGIFFCNFVCSNVISSQFDSYAAMPLENYERHVTPKIIKK